MDFKLLLIIFVVVCGALFVLMSLKVQTRSVLTDKIVHKIIDKYIEQRKMPTEELEKELEKDLEKDVEELYASTGLNYDDILRLLREDMRSLTFDDCVRLAPWLRQSVVATLRDAGLLPHLGENDITGNDLRYLLERSDEDLTRAIRSYIGVKRWDELKEKIRKVP